MIISLQRYIPWRGLLVLAVLLSAGFAISLGLQNYSGWLNRGSQEMGFILQDIEINGLFRTKRRSVLAKLDVEVGMPIVSIDLTDLAARVEALPWIETVELERQLPGLLRLNVTERYAFALWQKDSKLSLIDPNGVVIAVDDLRQFSHLPLVVGEGAAPAARHLLMLLDSVPELSGRVRSAVRVGDRRWDVLLHNGIRIKLPQPPRSNSPDAWDDAAAWARIASMQAEHSILEREIEVIDMRDPARVTFRLTEAGKRGLATMQFET